MRMGMYSRIFFTLIFLFLSEYSFSQTSPSATVFTKIGATCFSVGIASTPKCQSGEINLSITTSSGNTNWFSCRSSYNGYSHVGYESSGQTCRYGTCPAGLVPNNYNKCDCPGEGEIYDQMRGICTVPPSCDVGQVLSWTSSGPICVNEADSNSSSSASSLPPCSQTPEPYIVGQTCYDDSSQQSSSVSSYSASSEVGSSGSGSSFANSDSNSSQAEASSTASNSGGGGDSSSGNSDGSGDNSGGDSGSGGGSSEGGGGSNADTCDLYPDSPLCSSSSSSVAQDCLPGWHYYPNTYTCVPDSSSSSTGVEISSSSLSQASSSSSLITGASSSQASQNFSSSSSWYSDHNGETPIAENDPCPNKYQDNQGQWWCVNDTSGQGSSAASQSSESAVAWTDCDQRPVCDDGSTACAQLYQEWQTRCAGVAQWDQHQFDQPDDKNDITFAKSLERFKAEIQGSVVVTGITKFFSVQLSGSCPSWSVDVMVFHIVIDQFCSPGIPWDLIRGIIIAVALFLAARIALS